MQLRAPGAHHAGISGFLQQRVLELVGFARRQTPAVNDLACQQCLNARTNLRGILGHDGEQQGFGKTPAQCCGPLGDFFGR